MESIESMLKERGIDPNDPTVKYALEQKLFFGGVPTARKHIPKIYLGKNEYGQKRNQQQAREVVSRVFQIRGEFCKHAKKHEEIKRNIMRMKRLKRESPLIHKLRSIDQFVNVK